MTTIAELQSEQSRIAAKIAAHKEAEEIIAIITQSNGRIMEGNEGPEASRHLLETIDEHVRLLFRKVAPPPKSAPAPVGSGSGNGAVASPNGCAAQSTKTEKHAVSGPLKTIEALRLIDEIEELSMDMPDKAQDTAMGVIVKAKLIGATIEKTNAVSGQQLESLRDMRDRAKKLHRR